MSGEGFLIAVTPTTITPANVGAIPLSVPAYPPRSGDHVKPSGLVQITRRSPPCVVWTDANIEPVHVIAWPICVDVSASLRVHVVPLSVNTEPTPSALEPPHPATTLPDHVNSFIKAVDVLVDHVTPSALIQVVPWPEATKFTSVRTTPFKLLVVPLVRDVHVVPSELVKMVPLSPTATNSEPDHATEFNALVVPLVLVVHVIPSGLVRINPLIPTATKIDPDQTTEFKAVAWVVRSVQISPSGLEKTDVPTATIILLDAATACAVTQLD
jgi:hypothetical protein